MSPMIITDVYGYLGHYEDETAVTRNVVTIDNPFRPGRHKVTNSCKDMVTLHNIGA